MSLPGIDCSRWNGLANLASQSFQIARATYGTSPDAKYAAHTANARLQAVIPGAYHFGTAGSVAAQVDAFIAAIKPTGVKLVALDLEHNGTNTMTNDHAAQFIQGLHAKGYPHVGLYHSRSGFPHLGQDWDWIADWDATSFPAGAEMWQHQGNPIDRDLYNGTMAQLRVLAGIATPPVYHVSVQPQKGTRGYPALRYFNTFEVTGHGIDATHVARTGGFTLPCSAPARFVWPGHPAQQLVRPIVPASHRLYGQWIRAAYLED